MGAGERGDDRSPGIDAPQSGSVSPTPNAVLETAANPLPEVFVPTVAGATPARATELHLNHPHDACESGLKAMTAILEDVKDAPPSDPLVWLVLAGDGPLCVGDIVEAIGALQQLATAG